MSENISVFAPVLVYDSGLGGVSTLYELKKAFPCEDFVYFADFLNSPYGNKSRAYILRVVLDNIAKLTKVWKPKAIILACNTATSVCIQKLRQIYFNIPVVGIEPAIKPAILSGAKNILVLATKTTLKYSSVVKLYSKTQNSMVTFASVDVLAKTIDKQFLNPKKLSIKIEHLLLPFKSKFDAVVLGCTHYVLVKRMMKNALEAHTLFDGNAGVIKRVSSLLRVLGLKKEFGNGKVLFVSSVKAKQRLLSFAFSKQREGA